MAVVTALELGGWAVAWGFGFAPPAFVAGYFALAFAALAFAVALRLAFRLGPTSASWQGVVLGTALVGIGASAFLPLKYAIPKLVPFWLDMPLATAEQSLFGGHPWLLLDRMVGWATAPLDWLYCTWLPVQSLAMFLVMLARPSAAKSQALVAYIVAWLLLGVVAATLLSSAGPLFYDRLFGGSSFASLDETLRARGAWVALAESDAMWASMATSHPGLVAGISAVPSMHVAISLWIFLTGRTMAPRAAKAAFLYFILIWLGSVQLGWHYASDGLAGAIGMLLVWQLARTVGRTPPSRRLPSDQFLGAAGPLPAGP
jgi:hypothetical protein